MRSAAPCPVCRGGGGEGGANQNQWVQEFNRMVQAGAADMTAPVAPPENRREHRSFKAAAAALGAGSWQA